MLLVHGFASNRVRRAPAWDCGFPDARPQTQYSADSLAQPLRRVFGTSAHARIPREEQLPGVVGPLFRSALRSVDLRRRAWQRTHRTRERLRIERSMS